MRSAGDVERAAAAFKASYQVFVAVLGGNLHDALPQRWVERQTIAGQRPVERRSRLPNDLPVVGDRAEHTDHDGTQRPAIVVVAWRKG